jgi:hypothetical protein
MGVLAVGALLAWSGLAGKKVTAALRDLIAGKSPTTAADTSITPVADSTGEFGGQGLTGIGASIGGGSIATAAIAKKNQAIAAPIATLYGWGPGTSNWESLLKLWTKESGWNNRAENSTSGAYGIAQALGHGPTNQYPAGPANPPIASAAAQITWGLNYIKGRYGNPNAAWAHEIANNWY